MYEVAVIFFLVFAWFLTYPVFAFLGEVPDLVPTSANVEKYILTGK